MSYSSCHLVFQVAAAVAERKYVQEALKFQCFPRWANEAATYTHTVGNSMMHQSPK